MSDSWSNPEEAALKSVLIKVPVFVTALVMTLSMIGCAPSAQQLKSTMENNPDILYATMRKDPARFMREINELVGLARAQEEQMAFEESFKNPRTPEIQPGRGFEGSPTGPITVIEYSDFQCPYCRKGYNTMKDLLEEYPGQIRLVFKNFPIERIHPQAMKLSKTYEALVKKDMKKAALFKSQVFSRQADFNPTPEEAKAKSDEEFNRKYNSRVNRLVDSMLKDLGYDAAEINRLANSAEIAALIAADQREAQEFGFTGTPGYLVDGIAVRGAYELDTFKSIIDRRMKEKSGKK